MNEVFLSEVIATRLSHDLIGNIGAVNNAVELLNEGDEDDKDDIRNILNFSSDVLSKRLKFFRLCFGLSNASVKSIDELYKITSDYLSTLGNPSQPIQLILEIETPSIYKVVMPAIMLMADTLIKGGKVIVKQNAVGIHVDVLSDATLNVHKFSEIDLILAGQEMTDNPSVYAPLYYMMAYLDEGIEIRRQDQTLIIGE